MVYDLNRLLININSSSNAETYKIAMGPMIDLTEPIKPTMKPNSFLLLGRPIDLKAVAAAENATWRCVSISINRIVH